MREWHRHTRRNWVVPRQILAGMDAGRGIPLDSHIEKLRYIDDHALFDHDRLFLPGDTASTLVREQRPLIRSTNLEIEQRLRTLRSDDPATIRNTAEMVQRKFQMLFVTRLPAMVEPVVAATWPVDDVDAEIVAARRRKVADRKAQGDREDIVYRPS